MGEIRYLMPADKAISALPPALRAIIRADVELVAELGFGAPVVIRTISGHSPLVEIKNGNYRTFFFVEGGVTWVLHCCKKQDQARGIALAAKRMKDLRRR